MAIIQMSATQLIDAMAKHELSAERIMRAFCARAMLCGEELCTNAEEFFDEAIADAIKCASPLTRGQDKRAPPPLNSREWTREGQRDGRWRYTLLCISARHILRTTCPPDRTGATRSARAASCAGRCTACPSASRTSFIKRGCVDSPTRCTAHEQPGAGGGWASSPLRLGRFSCSGDSLRARLTAAPPPG